MTYKEIVVMKEENKDLEKIDKLVGEGVIFLEESMFGPLTRTIQSLLIIKTNNEKEIKGQIEERLFHLSSCNDLLKEIKDYL